jgi:NAD(P)H-flavin reductase
MFKSLKIGDSINVKGPKGSFKYEPNMYENIGMIAGGTGITPMFQVIQYILENPEDNTNVSLIFANVSIDDILLKNDLEKFTKHPQFKLYYVLDKVIHLVTLYKRRRRTGKWALVMLQRISLARFVLNLLIRQKCFYVVFASNSISFRSASND